ncbi:MAG TPA: hypothetical protein VFZ18_00270 [Longimicrobiaceae bacterium]
MRRTHAVAAALALVMSTGCADAGVGGNPLAPDLALGRSSEREARTARRIPASGEFQTFVDFSTLTLTPRGRNCRLEVDGEVLFTGTIEGTGSGHTSALVFAPCADVAAAPPGTYPDVFRSRIEVEVSVDGQPATARMIYQGRSAPGGAIDGRFLLQGGVRGALKVEARIAVGGTYEGTVVVR